MSRSRKKVWGWCDKSKGMKRFANKAVRNTQNLGNGSCFKRCFCSYDICDWKFLYFSDTERQEILNDENPYKAWIK